MNVVILKTALWMRKAVNRKTLKMNVAILKTALWRRLKKTGLTGCHQDL
jgi:hypothetical protein